MVGRWFETRKRSTKLEYRYKGDIKIQPEITTSIDRLLPCCSFLCSHEMTSRGFIITALSIHLCYSEVLKRAKCCGEGDRSLAHLTPNNT